MIALTSIRNKQDLINLDRPKKIQAGLDIILSINPHEQIKKIKDEDKRKHTNLNLSCYSFKDQKFNATEIKGKNFMLCDFEGTDLRGVMFTEACNFSLSINLDKAITDDKTEFNVCNMAGADLPKAKMIRCTIYPMDDNEIREHFEAEERHRMGIPDEEPNIIEQDIMEMK